MDAFVRSKIRLECFNARAKRFEIASRALDPFAFRDDQQVKAILSELLSQFVADAARCARHQGKLPYG